MRTLDAYLHYMTPTDSAIALAWCLGWERASLSELQAMRQALKSNLPAQVPDALHPICEQISQLQSLQASDFPEDLSSLEGEYPALWNLTASVGMVYGGATKIKSYLFEDAKLPDIRGASALLDQINQIDIPAFFSDETFDDNQHHHNQLNAKAWLTQSDNFPDLANALIPELIIYSTGGNILAFCPAPLVDDLADAIEKRYTIQTLTANSCAVGHTFQLLEVHFGRLSKPYENTPWLSWYRQAVAEDNPLVKSYFNTAQGDVGFRERKSFSELTTDLAVQFNQRRSGNSVQCSRARSPRCYPPMFETHPYLRRDHSDYRLAVAQPEEQAVPSQPWLSDTLARKRVTGQQTKNERSLKWFEESADFDWQLPTDQTKWKPNPNNKSWVSKFKDFLERDGASLKSKYYGSATPSKIKETRDLADIGTESKNFVAYIYADGNNMGGYIQKQIKTPEDYKAFSQDIFTATEYSVYNAIAQHLHPRKDSDNKSLRHPFEIVTIGGDDVFIIVPADKALEIAHTIGTKFEEILLKQHPLPSGLEIKRDYRAPESDLNPGIHHRYREETATPADCQLSISSGILIVAQNTPIYYAEQLTNQLLKSAKQKAKALNTAAKKEGSSYRGGTVDFLVMKSVTMLAASISAYREEALSHVVSGLNLRLYAAPYTLHELAGLIETVKALKEKESDLPRSQLYQIRSLLARGKRTAILNYRYFQSRLKTGKKDLQEKFDQSWCSAQTNNGNIAPWMYVAEVTAESVYETIWRDLVDLFDFIEPSSQSPHAVQPDPKMSDTNVETTAETSATLSMEVNS